MFERNCPYCNKKLFYKRKDVYERAIILKNGCRSCGQKVTKIKSGYKSCWNKGLKKDEDERVKNNCRNAFKNYNGKIKGKTYEEFYGEEKAKQIRLKKYREDNSWPNYNKKACKIIDEYGKQYNYNFQHAMNGGEFGLFTKNGNYYFVDGYDKKNNIVIEYYERNHNTKNNRERDEKRKNEIIEKLKCKFIEIKEWKL